MHTLLLMALQLSSLGANPPIIIPPKAAEVAGPIGELLLAPVFRDPFACTEHPFGQLPMAGDALGTDCEIVSGLDGERGFVRPFRTNGATNSDWYGWHAEVLSPTDGTVAGIFEKENENIPGEMGKPPASMIQIMRDDGVLVTLAHITQARIKIGDRVTAGQSIALVGNNGMARAPHIHIGAYRKATAEPLQIRWDLRAMAALQTDQR
ncbi:MAG TPA: M23 family metallopeptidase [Sphingomicrobium sp.]|nr:M23 family metallopeptidase [Sphingomicrobium sp.]